MTGVIDLGSNSFIGVVVDGKRDVFEDMVVVGLGSRIRGDFIEGCEEARVFFESLLEKMRNFTEDIRAFGTHVFRNAVNGGDCFKEITRGVDGRILSPWEEGRYSYLSVVWDEEINVSSPVVLDLGGGSLEIVTKDAISSLPYGTWNVKRALSGDPFEMAEKLSGEIDIPDGKIVGIGGTFVTIGAYKIGEWNLEKIHGEVITKEDVENLMKLIKDMDETEIDSLDFVPKGRGKTLLPGTIVALAILKKKNEMIVSKRGYRYGIAWEIEMSKK